MSVVVLALWLVGSLAFTIARRDRQNRAPAVPVLFPHIHDRTNETSAEGVSASLDPGLSRSWRTFAPMAIGTVAFALSVVLLLVDWTTRPRLAASTHSLEGIIQPVTSERGVEALPALSPDAGSIAYRSGEDGMGDILVREIDGDTVLNLTGHMNADERDPAFSPDGRQIAFRSTSGNGGIFVIDRNGARARRLTNFGASPAWTPDGGSIVFATRSSMDPRSWSGVSEGWIVDVKTGHSSRLTRHDFRQPAVSPDGRYIAYWSSSRPQRQPRGRSTPGIWTIGINGRIPRPVSRGFSMDWNPVWSPDGEFLYFLSDRGGRVGIWRVSMDRNNGTSLGEPVRISVRSDNAAHLAIANDGRHLAWSTLEWRPTLFRVGFEADTRSTTGDPAAVATGPASWQCAEPSPDGSLIAFASDQQQRDIHLLRVDTGAVRHVTDDSAAEGCPRWSPDGRRIIFHSDAGDLNRLWVADADGTGLRLAARAIGGLTNPVWAPDGRAIAAWDSYAATLRVIRLREGRAPSSETLPAPPHPFTPAAWSPDGTQIAGTAAGALWVYGLAARSYELLLPGSSPAWLSSNSRLIYASDGRLMMLDLPSRYTREILMMPDLPLDAPFLSPDDRHLYFNRNATESNIWLLKLR